jgi:4-hydroxy-tetrahydrodipicolinate reductase
MESEAMQDTRIIIFGVGSVGKEVVRALMAKKGVQIVGALDKGPIAGLDLGDVVGLGRKLGIAITNNEDALFAGTKADVLIHTTTTHVADTYEQLRKPIAAGINVITAAEEMSSPSTYDPEATRLLDDLAKNYGVAVLGTGLWPTYVDIDIPLLLSAGSRDVRGVKYCRHSDFRAYVGSVVAKHFGMGVTKEAYAQGVRDGVIVGHVGFEGSFERLGHYFGWTIDKVTKDEAQFYGPAGTTTGIRTIARGWEKGVQRIEMEIHVCIDEGWETYDKFDIEGEVPTHVTIRPALYGTSPVANVLVNHIPALLQAKPGIVLRSSVGAFAFGGEVGKYLSDR